MKTVESDKNIRGGTWTGDHVWFPRGHGHGVGVGGVTAPQTLDKLSGRHAPPDKVLLALLLLNLQCKTGTQYSLEIDEKIIS